MDTKTAAMIAGSDGMVDQCSRTVITTDTPSTMVVITAGAVGAIE